MGQFERIRYPDGQVGAKWVGDLSDIHNLVVIKERINSYEDLAYIRAIGDILEYHKTECSIEIPCLFGQRSDRRFSDEQSFDLRLIVEVINSCNFLNVVILDPHSDVCMALINNSHKKSSFPYVQDAVMDIRQRMCDTGLSPSKEDIVLVSPDAGAYKKIFQYAETLRMPVVAAVKHRDSAGKIDLTFMGDVKDKHCLIVDDLCSRGGTFLKLAEQLRHNGAQKVYLYVSHFEGGCEEYKQTIINLREKIDRIYTTNSFREFDEDDNKNLTVYKVI